MMERSPASVAYPSFQNVQFNLFFQAKLSGSRLSSGRHGNHLIFRIRLLRFRFDKQRALEADFMFMLNHHLHKAAQLLRS